MPEFKLDYTFREPAREAFDALNEFDQAELRRRVDLLCTDPTIDRVTKFPWPVPGPERAIFTDGQWEIIYRLVDENRVVEIWALARVQSEHGGTHFARRRLYRTMLGRSAAP